MALMALNRQTDSRCCHESPTTTLQTQKEEYSVRDGDT